MSRRASYPVLQRQRTSLFKRFGYFRTTAQTGVARGRSYLLARVIDGSIEFAKKIGREFLKRRFFLLEDRKRYYILWILSFFFFFLGKKSSFDNSQRKTIFLYFSDLFFLFPLEYEIFDRNCRIEELKNRDWRILKIWEIFLSKISCGFFSFFYRLC